MLTVRNAVIEDAQDLLAWRNDVDSRAQSRHSTPVPEAAHRAWMDKALADPSRLLLIGEVGGDKVGTVRFDLQEDGTWEVSINVAPDHRGLGLGLQLLSASIRHFNHVREHAELVAHIRLMNDASRRIFEAEGFRLFHQDEAWMTFRREI